MLRHALVLPEAAVYGVSYAFLQNIIRSPTPLDPEWTWHVVTRDMPHGTDWIRAQWPLKPLRRADPGRQDAAGPRPGHLGPLRRVERLLRAVPRQAVHVLLVRRLPSARRDDRGGPAAQGRPHPQPDRPQAGRRRFWSSAAAGARCSAASPSTPATRRTCTGSRCRRSRRRTTASTTASTSTSTTSSPASIRAKEFDAIYSIGAWEHVRQHEIPPLLGEAVRRPQARRPAGAALHHAGERRR